MENTLHQFVTRNMFWLGLTGSIDNLIVHHSGIKFSHKFHSLTYIFNLHFSKLLLLVRVILGSGFNVVCFTF